MTQETNFQRFAREMREGGERLDAEQAKDPQFAAMAKAAKRTKDEQAAIDAAQAAVDEAEAAVNGTGLTLARAKRGQAPTYDQKRPFSFFEKSKSAHKAAADAAVPGLAIDMAEAQNNLQMAIRRRNGTARRIELERMERRRSAKAAHAPERPPVKRRGDPFNMAHPPEAA